MHKEASCKLEIQGVWTMEKFMSFQMLYAPLIGMDATLLYQTMLSIASSRIAIKNHLLICEISGLSVENIEKQRAILEQYLLVKTYYNQQHDKYLYHLFMPKDGSEFLRHEVFGRLYFKKMGEQVYEYNKRCFAKNYEDLTDYEDISIPFTNILRDKWLDDDERGFRNNKPDEEDFKHNDIPLSFNYDRFFSQVTNSVFPQSERSEPNLRLIGEMATIYGIDETTMVKIVSQSIDVKTMTFKPELLKKKARAMKPNYAQIVDVDVYSLSPIRFMQMKQHGVDVSRSDKYLIESLIYEYKLKPEVINVLIEYVLDTKKQQFPKAYVEKVALTWVRLGIDTKEKALEQIQQGSDNVSKATTTTVKPTTKEEKDEIPSIDREKMMERIKKFRGE